MLYEWGGRLLWLKNVVLFGTGVLVAVVKFPEDMEKQYFKEKVIFVLAAWIAISTISLRYFLRRIVCRITISPCLSRVTVFNYDTLVRPYPRPFESSVVKIYESKYRVLKADRLYRLDPKGTIHNVEAFRKLMVDATEQ